MAENHSLFKTRIIGEDAELSVYLTLLKARQGPYPFVRHETLRDTVSLLNGELEGPIDRLEEEARLNVPSPAGAKSTTRSGKEAKL